MKTFLSLLLLAIPLTVSAAPKQVRVFVALCDNKSQGIQPVGKKIGDGDEPDENLYWGCTDGFGSFFRKSGNWKVTSSKSAVSDAILRRISLRHSTKDIEIVADAYRGSAMKQCVKDFEKAAAGNQYELVAFIGHNGLMDFELPAPTKTAGNDTDVIVLCCMSEIYFGKRLRNLGCRTVLMTRQLMYPGSFILDAALESWSGGGSLTQDREAAGRAYAHNQKISVRAATGVFALPGE